MNPFVQGDTTSTRENVDMENCPAASEILYLSFTYDGRFLCTGNRSGFEVYDCTTSVLRRVTRRSFRAGGFGIVEMMNGPTNIFALVGGGPTPCFHPTKVVVWDESEARCIGEIPFTELVLGVRVRRDFLVVALEAHIYFYAPSLDCLGSSEATYNPYAAFALAPTMEPFAAYPSPIHGVLRVLNLKNGEQVTFHSHRNPIACIATSITGKFIATASTSGTVIKIHHIQNKCMHQELRRGSTHASLYDMCFSRDDQYFACVSNNATLHIYRIAQESASGDHLGKGSSSEASAQNTHVLKNRSSSLSFLKSVVPLKAIKSYVASEWNFAWFTEFPAGPATCCFGTEVNELFLLSWDGSFLVVQFDPEKGGNCVCIRKHKTGLVLTKK